MREREREGGNFLGFPMDNVPVHSPELAKGRERETNERETREIGFLIAHWYMLRRNGHQEQKRERERPPGEKSEEEVEPRSAERGGRTGVPLGTLSQRRRRERWNSTKRERDIQGSERKPSAKLSQGHPKAERSRERGEREKERETIVFPLAGSGADFAREQQRRNMELERGNRRLNGTSWMKAKGGKGTKKRVLVVSKAESPWL